METNIFVNIYIDKDKPRFKELLTSFYLNIKNPKITRIIAVYAVDGERVQFESLQKLFKEGESPMDKVKFVKQASRPTYNDFFQMMGAYPNQINILTNLDIIFSEEDIVKMYSHQWVKNKGIALAMSRWDIVSDKPEINFKSATHFARSDSQDVWVFNGIVGRIPDADFVSGIAGCDNRIAYLLSLKYRLFNPSIDIRAYHYHITVIRNYISNGKVVEKVDPPYGRVVPCKLEDVK